MAVNKFIGKENGKLLQALATKARLENAARLKEAAEIVKSIQATSVALTESGEVFRISSLARVRKQMQSILDDLTKEDDPAKLDRLASALERLERMERSLSMRAIAAPIKQPANRKPAQDDIAPQ